MKILTRYVLIEILKIFVISLALTTFFLVVVMGAREALRSGLPATLAVEVLPYLLPEVLGITIPVCVLLAVTVFFSRFAGSNELLCLLSTGISPLRLIWPVLTWATVVSMATVACYEASATWGRPGMRQRVLISLPRIAVARLQMEKSFRTPAFSVVVKEVQGNRLWQAVITIPARGNQPEITISAQMVELEVDARSGQLILRCHNGEVEVEDKGRVRFSDTIEQIIPLEAPGRPLNRNWLAMGDIPHALAQVRRELDSVRQGPARAINPEEQSRVARLEEELRQQLNRLGTEPVRRWANGFSCLCFALVGIGVALRARSDNFLTSFFLCFAPIGLIYYPLLMFSDQITSSGLLPPVAFLLADLCLVVAGIALLRLSPM